MYYVMIGSLENNRAIYASTQARSPAHAITTVAQYARIIDLQTAVRIGKDPSSWPMELADLGYVALVATR